MQSRTGGQATAAISQPEVVLSSTHSDSHTYNLCFLQMVLEEHNCDVSNLGACVSPELLAERCASRPPALIVLSSVNGHGYYDGQLAVQTLRQIPTLTQTPIVIGGKLGIGELDEVRSAALLKAGFNAVFDDSDEDLAKFQTFVRTIVARSTNCLKPVAGARA